MFLCVSSFDSTEAPPLSPDCPIIIDIDDSGNATTCLEQWRCASLQEAANAHDSKNASSTIVRLPNDGPSLFIDETFQIPHTWSVLQARNISSPAPLAMITCDTAPSPCLVWANTAGDPLQIRHIAFQGNAAPFINLMSTNAWLRLHDAAFHAAAFPAIGLPTAFAPAQVVSTATSFANVTLRPDATNLTCRFAGLCEDFPEWYTPPSPSSSPSRTPSTVGR